MLAKQLIDDSAYIVLNHAIVSTGPPLRACPPGVYFTVIRKAQTRFTRQRRRSAFARRSIVAALTLLVIGGSAAISEALAIDLVRVNEVAVPLSHIEDWAEGYRDRWQSAELTLLVDDRPYRTTRAELGASLPLDELLASIERAGNRDSGEDLPTVYWSAEVDHAQLLATTFALRERITPVDNAGNPPPNQRTLDLHGALKVLKQTLPTSQVLVTLPTRKPVLRGLVAGARPGTFSRRLALHTSTYRTVGRSWSRGHNIEQGAKALDGVVIEPYGELSFNEIVGDRSFQRGFMPANEIARGRVVDGIGGGVCQVATALHAAALRAGFEILEHYVHSKRPKYAGRGLDTAVAWGLKDLRIRNPYGDYVRIRSGARSGTLSLEFWSGHAPPKVEIATETLRGTLGERQKLLLIERTRTVHWPDGPKSDTKVLRYPAEPKK